MTEHEGFKRTRDLHLGELGIDAYAQVIEYPDGTHKLLIKKPSGQAWVDLRDHDFIEPSELVSGD